jgi:hypothetical protein
MEIPYKHSVKEASIRFLDSYILSPNRLYEPRAVGIVRAQRRMRMTSEEILEDFFEEKGKGIVMAAALAASEHEVLRCWASGRVRFALYRLSEKESEKIMVNLAEKGEEMDLLDISLREREERILAVYQDDLKKKTDGWQAYDGLGENNP